MTERVSRPQKRRSRWNDEKSRTLFPTLSTLLPTQLNEEMMEQYLRILQIEELSRRLRVDDVLPRHSERSLSPEPIYGIDGKRVNTREARYREKLEHERHRLIEDALKADPLYRPPADYRKPSKNTEKIYIPAREFPEINFIGLLIGPRGNTLKRIETQSGAKISIRGKGSAKEGKKDQKPQPGDDEELHALVMGDAEDKVKKAVDMINRIIEESCSMPEAQNELKKQQLRELALLNGTMRDDESMLCQNCGEFGHRKYECPKRLNVTNSTVCKICGGAGHVAKDCLRKNNPEALKAAELRDKQVDTEYARFMAEMIGGGDGPKSASAQQNAGTSAANSNMPSWLANAPWLNQNQNDPYMVMGAGAMQQGPPPTDAYGQQYPPPPGGDYYYGNYTQYPPPPQEDYYPPMPSDQ